MNKNEITEFDVLIVYSDRLAQSASNKSAKFPFSKKSGKQNYNTVYSYFLKVCKRNGLMAAFTSSGDIAGPGMCKSYWTFKNGAWHKVLESGFSKLIFDKVSPVNDKRSESYNLLFSSKGVAPFNDRDLFKICFDKQKTYDKFKAYAIPTVSVERNNKKEFNKAYKKLRYEISKHQNEKDFSDQIIIKDRFGAGGLNIYKYKLGNQDLPLPLKNHKKISFIIQPFVNFDKGFVYKKTLTSTDIRVIFLGKKIIQTYIRIAKQGEFRCNEHAGGLLKYVKREQLPKKIIKTSKVIAKKLNKKNALFTLDFVLSNSGRVYLLEANTKPGLDWNQAKIENEIEAKKLIRIVVKEIVRRTHKLNRNHKETLFTSSHAFANAY